MRSRYVPFSALLGLAFAFTASGANETVKNAARAGAICSAAAGELAVADARLFAMGNYRGPLVSGNSQAQRFFDQGLVFGWGFNFAEAVRSFRAAVRLDPDCAMCRWGIAWALGPSINHDMREADVPIALDAIVQAKAHAQPGSRERALIDALATRYSSRRDADALYANAMRTLANRFPADADIAVLAAEALMNAHPYDYWSAGGRARSWTPQIIAWLDRALHLAPDHPGAHHYRIHLFEESQQPEQALASAEKLGALAPMTGHLVHMPSHIYFRLGRYHDAMLANQAAVQADRDYSAAAGASSDYAIHNLHFLWVSALWSADGEVALRAADELAAAAARLPSEDATAGTRQHFSAAPLLTQVRLGRWDALAMPPSLDTSAQPYLAGLTQFASGMGYSARGNVAAARTQLDLLRRSERLTEAAKLTVKNINQAADVLRVARLLLQSAIAGERNDAVRYARAAVRAEDRLAADDPPVWVVPARHALAVAEQRLRRPQISFPTSSSLSARHMALSFE